MPKLPFAALLLAGGIACGTHTVRAQPATDSLGDPLPRGARLRLGTIRFQAPSAVADLALSPDETTLVSVGNELIAWDTATGKERWRASPTMGNPPSPAGYGVRALAFSAD